MRRRTFVTGTALAAGLARTPLAFASRKLESFGVQLSTITRVMLEDFAGALSLVSSIGYDEVEFSASGFLGRPVNEIRDLLAANELAAPVGRVAPKLPESAKSLAPVEVMALIRQQRRPELFPQMIEDSLADALELGQGAMNLPGLLPASFQTMDGVKQNLTLLQQTGERCAAAGVKFGYHNHAFELAELDGIVPLDFLIENTDPEHVTFQLDVYWIAKGGGDPFDYLARYPGRFESCHLKDIDDAGDFADVGSRNIDFPRFVREALATGSRHFFVERDNPPSPIESITRSYTYLDQMRF